MKTSEFVNQTMFGDCRESMSKMIAAGQRVQMCVTSPPYFGLRDYGHPGQLGLEKTPDEYIAHMVDVFRFVRDLLAEDGTLWLNLGDSYNAYNGGAGPGSKLSKTQTEQRPKLSTGYGLQVKTMKPKDLLGIPWKVAFALQSDGWFLRQDIIWHKPNPMPESVTDRCTKAHEYLFLLSKSARYYFNQEAIKEPVKSGPSDIKKMKESRDRIGGKHKVLVDPLSCASSTTNIGRKRSFGNGEFRNRRSVWTVATQPYSGAHFATFPPALIEPCILAGSRAGDVVLDPFMGSGTTAMVAQNLGRNWIGCEINADYLPMQLSRTRQVGLVL